MPWRHPSGRPGSRRSRGPGGGATPRSRARGTPPAGVTRTGAPRRGVRPFNRRPSGPSSPVARDGLAPAPPRWLPAPPATPPRHRLGRIPAPGLPQAEPRDHRRQGRLFHVGGYYPPEPQECQLDPPRRPAPVCAGRPARRLALPRPGEHPAAHGAAHAPGGLARRAPGLRRRPGMARGWTSGGPVPAGRCRAGRRRPAGALPAHGSRCPAPASPPWDPARPLVATASTGHRVAVLTIFATGATV